MNKLNYKIGVNKTMGWTPLIHVVESKELGLAALKALASIIGTTIDDVGIFATITGKIEDFYNNYEIGCNGENLLIISLCSSHLLSHIEFNGRQLFHRNNTMPLGNLGESKIEPSTMPGYRRVKILGAKYIEYDEFMTMLNLLEK